MDDQLISDFMSIGCKCRKMATIALQVYLELCEVKRYWNVAHKYHTVLDLLYFTANKNASEPQTIYIPIDAHTNDLSLNKMRSFFDLCENETKSVFLVLVSSDSTCVFYQLTDGLFEPTDLTAKHLKFNKQEQLDAEIRKHRTVLEEAALCGVPVTIPRTSNESK